MKAILAVGLLVIGLTAGFAVGLGITNGSLTGAASTATPVLQGGLQGSSAPSASGEATAAAAPSLEAPSSSPGTTPLANAAPYRGPMTRTVPVLMYHLIGDPPPGAPYPGLYVSVASFDAQMHALQAAGWHTITAGQLGAAMAANQPVPVRTIVLTFDDGYADNYTNALPILLKYGFVATFSVVAHAGQEMMTPSQLATLVADGMEVGNHTMNHRNVSRLVGAQLVEQIQGGATTIEAKLASQGASEVLRTFVYPSGHVGPAALALLQQLGYTDAFTEVPGDCHIGTTPPLQIPRIRVSRSESVDAFLARLPAEPPRP